MTGRPVFAVRALQWVWPRAFWMMLGSGAATLAGGSGSLAKAVTCGLGLVAVLCICALGFVGEKLVPEPAGVFP
jgi:hypothetical protein